jgi:adenosylhomocysteine nucleosidase
MRPELRPLIRPLALRRPRSGDGLREGSIGRVHVLAAITGIGMAAAARTAERVLDAGAIDHLVVVGIAGGIGPSVRVGDLVVPERVVDLATGAEHRPLALGGAVPRGTLLTADGLLTGPAAYADFERRGAVAIDMETAAVAAVCERRGCPWSVFRGISDHPDHVPIDRAVFELAGPDGGPNLRKLVRFLLTQPRRIPELVRLGLDMQRAAGAAASAAAAALAKL